MRKPLIAALVTTAALMTAGAAHAGSNVFWSIGISAPAIGTVISNTPVYYPQPQVVYAPPPVVYAPPPVVYAPPPVIYRPAPRVVYQQPVVVSRPVPVVYGGWGYRQGDGRGYGDRDHDGVPNRWDRYDNRGHGQQYGDRDRDGIPDYRDRYDNRKHGH
jgi:hypothetical protein